MLELLLKLETSLWINETRNNLYYMEKILHPDFKEVGQSGRTYLKEDVLQAGEIELHAEFPLKDLDVRKLEEGIYLINYGITYNGKHSKRLSIWMVKGDSYQLYYHQGTPCD